MEGELRGLSGWIRKRGAEGVQQFGEWTKKVWRKRRRTGGGGQADI